MSRLWRTDERKVENSAVFWKTRNRKILVEHVFKQENVFSYNSQTMITHFVNMSWDAITRFLGLQQKTVFACRKLVSGKFWSFASLPAIRYVDPRLQHIALHPILVNILPPPEFI